MSSQNNYITKQIKIRKIDIEPLKIKAVKSGKSFSQYLTDLLSDEANKS